MRRLLGTMRIAFRALEVNKARSSLTMLGIVIGVAAVIATAAIGSGAKERIQQQIASIGSNTIIVLPGSLTGSGLRMGTGNAIGQPSSSASLPAFSLRDLSIAEGSTFSQQDVDSANKVALVGQTVVTNLFGEHRSRGPLSSYQECAHSLSWACLRRRARRLPGQDQDDIILLPISTAHWYQIGKCRCR